MGAWVIEQHAIILSATARSPTVIYLHQFQSIFCKKHLQKCCGTALPFSSYSSIIKVVGRFPHKHKSSEILFYSETSILVAITAHHAHIGIINQQFHRCKNKFESIRIVHITGGHRTRVAAVTLDNMAEDAVDASASLRQILIVSVRCCGPAFVSWLSMLWDILTRNPELQWFGISPQFRLKVSRGDEGVGHVCFPGDEGVGRL